MQIGNKISIIPQCDVNAVSSSEITLSRNDRKITLLTDNDMELTSTPTREDPGNLYSYQIVAVVNKFSGWKKYAGQSLVLQLYMTDGSNIYAGNKALPVRGLWNEFADKLQITFTWKSLIPLF